VTVAEENQALVGRVHPALRLLRAQLRQRAGDRRQPV
jgi:hypothetical protein